jgi:hypothetical protein
MAAQEPSGDPVSAGRRDTLAFGICAGLLAALVLAVHVVRLPEPLGVDQGLFACFARWVPRGALPYRDLFDSKPPLFLYWWAASSIVPGDVVRAAWWWEGIWLAATLGVAYLLGSRLRDRWVGLVAATLLFIGLWSPAWGDRGEPFWSRGQAEEVLALPMLGSAWLAWRAIDRAPLAFWSGVLVGVCGLFKIPSMVIAIAWLVGWLTTCPGREVARRVGLMAVGALAPWGLALAWFAAHGATASFIEGVFVYHRYNAAFVAPPWGGVLQQYAMTMLTQAPLLLVAAAIGVFRLARRRGPEAHWAAAWIVATMAGVVAQRQLAGYQFMLAVPALAVVGALGVVDVARSLGDRDARTLAAAALGGLALFTANEGLAWWRTYSPDAACLTGRISRPDYLRAIQPGGFSMADEEEAARRVRESTAPGDGILVWGLSPGLYALADRHPVTRYPFHKILLTDAPLSRMWPGLDQRRVAFMERLRGDPPAVVLVGQNDANGFEPQDSYGSLGRFRELRAMLQGGYEPAPPIGRFLVYRRAARTSPTSTINAPSATAP